MTGTSSNIPKSHEGTPYIDFVARLASAMAVDTYLEIGVQAGLLFKQVKAKTAIAVDPHFRLESDLLSNKTAAYFYQMTSDEYFRKNHAQIDLGFLDGLHLYEYLLRDFINCEALCKKGSLLLLHDCLPLNGEMINRNEVAAGQLGKDSTFPGYWTGDVWKVVQILLDYRPDLVVNCFDCWPTGLVCISNLDAASKILSGKYFEILDKFNDMDNNMQALARYYEGFRIRSAKEFVERDMFSTLYR